jgi:hypothetical protein
MEVINEWIEGCDDVDLKYVLFCLGHMGMRAGEVKFSHVDWYKDGICKIPAKLTYKTKKRAKKIWSPKNGTGRAIGKGNGGHDREGNGKGGHDREGKGGCHSGGARKETAGTFRKGTFRKGTFRKGTFRKGTFHS